MILGAFNKPEGVIIGLLRWEVTVTRQKEAWKTKNGIRSNSLPTVHFCSVVAFVWSRSVKKPPTRPQRCSRTMCSPAARWRGCRRTAPFEPQPFTENWQATAALADWRIRQKLKAAPGELPLATHSRPYAVKNYCSAAETSLKTAEQSDCIRMKAGDGDVPLWFWASFPF